MKEEIFRVLTSINMCGWEEEIMPIVFYFDVKDAWWYDETRRDKGRDIRNTD